MRYLLLVAAVVLGLNTFAQKKIDPATKYFYKDVTLETDDYKAYFVDVVAVGKQVKYKIKIFNKTNDYLYVKPSEISYVCGSKTLHSTDKNYAIPPNDEISYVIDYKSTDLQVEKFNLQLNGVYKVSAGGQIIRVPNFNLPPTKNDFTSGNFFCILKKNANTTPKAYATFECSYSGDAIGIINPNKCIAIMPNGADNPNSKNTKPMLLEKGKSDDFTAVFLEVKGAGDLQKKSIAINWNETFRESKIVKLASSTAEFIKESEKK